MASDAVAKGYSPLSLRIAGERIPAAKRKTTDVINPATGEVLAQLPHVTAEDLRLALVGAQQGFSRWRAVSAYDRAKVLRRAAQIIRERAEAISIILTLEEGKTLAEAMGEVLFSADVFEWFAEECRRTYGRVIPSRDCNSQYIAMKEPVGPVLAITPWNFPALTPARKIGASLAAGCSCIIKPAKETPGVTLALADALADAGLPRGVLSVVFGNSSLISDTLLSSDVIRKLSFTGSTEVGKTLIRQCADSVKRTTMELGGHAPVLITGDVNPSKVAMASVAAKFRNAGQVCISPTRFIVHQAIHEKFVEEFAKAANSMRVGDGSEKDSQMGPVANSHQLEVMETLISDAVEKGATLVCGGKRMGNRGFFWQPTLLADVPKNARIMNEEPFGPVAVTTPFNDLEDAISEANRLPFGLAAYAFTNSIADEAKMISGIESGMIATNTFSITMPETPFGGVKQSGFGIEGGIEGLEAYLELKFVSRTVSSPFA